MAVIYTGDETAAQSPGASPGPFEALLLSLTEDVDGGTLANLWQAWKANADFTTFLNKVARYMPPVTYGPVVGFSAVAHSGSGTGTVTPGGACTGGARVVIKITVAGAVGVARFIASLDGGKTWSSSTLSTGSPQHLGVGDTDATVTLAGTFVLDDTYSFRQALTPIMQAKRSTFSRFAIDHNGIDTGGRIRRVDEPWRTQQSAGSTDPLTNYPHIRFTRTGTTFQYATAVGAFPYMTILTGANASGDYGYLREDMPQTTGVAALGNSVLIIEGDALPPSSSDLDFYFGLSSSSGTPHSASNYVGFRAATGTGGADGTIKGLTKSGGVSTSVSTGVGWGGGTWQQLRIEWHGPSTPLATALSAVDGVVLFFVGSQLYGYSITNIPSSSMYFVFGALSLSGALSLTYGFSPYAVRTTRT